MPHPELSTDVADLNAAYLLTAQKLLREDRCAAMLQLGYTPEMADVVGGLHPAQILKLASTNTVLCGLRMARGMPAVLRDDCDDWVQRMHLFIILAGELHDLRPEAADEEIPA